MKARAKSAVRWAKARGAWLAVVVAITVGVVLAIPVARDVEFYRSLVATYIGAVIGFLVALYIDRRQRAEDADAQRRRNAAEEDLNRAKRAEDADLQRQRDAALDERERARRAGEERARRVGVLALLREELGRIPEQMVKPYRQDRNSAPFDRLTDVLWQSLSASGELRWIAMWRCFGLSPRRTTCSASRSSGRTAGFRLGQ